MRLYHSEVAKQGNANLRRDAMCRQAAKSCIKNLELGQLSFSLKKCLISCWQKKKSIIAIASAARVHNVDVYTKPLNEREHVDPGD